MPKTFRYGGQAIMEGVMMRGPKNLAMAVRRPDGEIDITVKPLPSIYTGRLRRIPFLRGILVLIEAMVIGVQCIFHSANIALGEEEELSGAQMWVVLAFSIVLSVGLFFVAPLFLANISDTTRDSSVLFHVAEGIIRIGIFLLYLGFMNLIPSTRDFFAYHGAEHKVVNAYEHGAPLEIEATRNYSTAHTRCGTAFLLAVLVIAIGVFALVGTPAMWIRILSRIVLIPVIAAIAYEITQLGATHSNNPLVRAILTPGLALQMLTTRQPNDSQLEVAILALKNVVEEEQPLEQGVA
ncbi:MAG: DUF1385 domain-containing protein [Chloroflexota bacterium]|nr:DUF1385 domain-containing protein [Chloroflexota bacterium]